MIDPVRLATSLFGWCTQLFPKEFRRDYRSELQGVFRSRAKDAIQSGGIFALIAICLNELHDLPGNVLNEYLASFRKAFGQSRFLGSIRPLRCAGQGAIGFG